MDAQAPCGGTTSGPGVRERALSAHVGRSRKQIQRMIAKKDGLDRAKADPYLRATYSFRHKAARATWALAYIILFRPSPRCFHSWRAWVLRRFGARLGDNCHIYPRAAVWAPWNLACDDQVTVADGAVIYNPAIVVLGSHAILSQDSYLCGATHDYDDPCFPVIARPISLGAYSWVCARACVQPGVSIAEGAVLALGAVATRDLAPWGVYGGIPAKRIKSRVRQPEAPDSGV